MLKHVCAVQFSHSRSSHHRLKEQKQGKLIKRKQTIANAEKDGKVDKKKKKEKEGSLGNIEMQERTIFGNIFGA